MTLRSKVAQPHGPAEGGASDPGHLARDRTCLNYRAAAFAPARAPSGFWHTGWCGLQPRLSFRVRNLQHQLGLSSPRTSTCTSHAVAPSQDGRDLGTQTSQTNLWTYDASGTHINPLSLPTLLHCFHRLLPSSSACSLYLRPPPSPKPKGILHFVCSEVGVMVRLLC